MITPKASSTKTTVAVKRSEVRILKDHVVLRLEITPDGCSQTIRGQDTERWVPIQWPSANAALQSNDPRSGY